MSSESSYNNYKTVTAANLENIERNIESYEPVIQSPRFFNRAFRNQSFYNRGDEVLVLLLLAKRIRSVQNQMDIANTMIQRETGKRRETLCKVLSILIRKQNDLIRKHDLVESEINLIYPNGSASPPTSTSGGKKKSKTKSRTTTKTKSKK